jgi:hypothetical protein
LVIAGRSQSRSNMTAAVTFAKSGRLIGAPCCIVGQTLRGVKRRFALDAAGGEESLLEYGQSVQYIFTASRMTCEGNLR